MLTLRYNYSFLWLQVSLCRIQSSLCIKMQCIVPLTIEMHAVIKAWLTYARNEDTKAEAITEAPSRNDQSYLHIVRRKLVACRQLSQNIIVQIRQTSSCIRVLSSDLL